MSDGVERVAGSRLGLLISGLNTRITPAIPRREKSFYIPAGSVRRKFSSPTAMSISRAKSVNSLETTF